MTRVEGCVDWGGRLEVTEVGGWSDLKAGTAASATTCVCVRVERPCSDWRSKFIRQMCSDWELFESKGVQITLWCDELVCGQNDQIPSPLYVFIYASVNLKE